ncbi:hypothetical protein M2273_001013 [Mucilaginibacter lappiensis]
MFWSLGIYSCNYGSLIRERNYELLDNTSVVMVHLFAIRIMLNRFQAVSWAYIISITSNTFIGLALNYVSYLNLFKQVIVIIALQQTQVVYSPNIRTKRTLKRVDTPGYKPADGMLKQVQYDYGIPLTI